MPGFVWVSTAGNYTTFNFDRTRDGTEQFASFLPQSVKWFTHRALGARYILSHPRLGES
jgi:hypothetical protein